jgi:hypothetical protein
MFVGGLVAEGLMRSDRVVDDFVVAKRGRQRLNPWLGIGALVELFIEGPLDPGP